MDENFALFNLTKAGEDNNINLWAQKYSGNLVAYLAWRPLYKRIFFPTIRGVNRSDD